MTITTKDPRTGPVGLAVGAEYLPSMQVPMGLRFIPGGKSIHEIHNPKLIYHLENMENMEIIQICLKLLKKSLFYLDT